MEASHFLRFAEIAFAFSLPRFYVNSGQSFCPILLGMSTSEVRKLSLHTGLDYKTVARFGKF